MNISNTSNISIFILYYIRYIVRGNVLVIMFISSIHPASSIIGLLLPRKSPETRVKHP